MNKEMKLIKLFSSIVVSFSAFILTVGQATFKCACAIYHLWNFGDADSKE